MEEEKKKKKSKKKKSKQNKTTELVAGIAVESSSVDNSHSIENGQHNDPHISEAADGQNDVVQNAKFDVDRSHANDTKCASFGEKIKQLQEENDIQLREETSLKEKLTLLQKEKELQIQKEVSLEEKVKVLQKEKDALIYKEADLEEKIKQLEEEKDAHIRKEAVLEKETLQLRSEKHSWLQKEVILEETLKQLDRERDSWVQNENSFRETIATLNVDNTKLLAQVLELEEFRNSLLQENQRLTENISGLQLQIQSLERSIPSPYSSTDSTMHASENGGMNSQMEAARLLFEKLITENAELVEKVNELYVELDQRGVTTERSSSVGSDPQVGTAISADATESSAVGSAAVVGTGTRYGRANAENHMFEVSDRMAAVGERMESLEDVVNDEIVADNLTARETLLPNAVETIETEGIVQVPLDDSDTQVTDVRVSQGAEEEVDVPLTDAPLIGAPFRLMSFVARYVSGADLVNKSSVSSSQ